MTQTFKQVKNSLDMGQWRDVEKVREFFTTIEKFYDDNWIESINSEEGKLVVGLLLDIKEDIDLLLSDDYIVSAMTTALKLDPLISNDDY